jgi:hypothetical protein
MNLNQLAAEGINQGVSTSKIQEALVYLQHHPELAYQVQSLVDSYSKATELYEKNGNKKAEKVKEISHVSQGSTESLTHDFSYGFDKLPKPGTEDKTELAKVAETAYPPVSDRGFPNPFDATRRSR